jgi:hypothetical protein
MKLPAGMANKGQHMKKIGVAPGLHRACQQDPLLADQSVLGRRSDPLTRRQPLNVIFEEYTAHE